MTMNKTSDLRGEDIIDSRDVIARIEDLESDVESLYQTWLEEYNEISEIKLEDNSDTRERFDQEHHDEDIVEELRALKALADDASSSPDWSYGEGLIKDSYFETYAEQLADDIGAIDRNANWPINCIDWEKAAEQLKQDYMSVEFDGETYWIRG